MRVVLVSCLLASGCNGEGDGTTPEELLKRETGIVLPPEAENIFCYEESLAVQWVFARFDLPRGSLDGFLSRQELLPKASLLEENAEIRANMNIGAQELAWWKLDSEGEGSCGETTSRRPGRSGDWERTSRICVVPLPQDMVRVYLQSIEQSVPPKEVGPK